jgi:hypothetical protein
MRDEWDWEGDGKGDWEANGSERVFDHFCRIYARGLSQIVSGSVSTRARFLSLWKKYSGTENEINMYKYKYLLWPIRVCLPDFYKNFGNKFLL